MVPYCVDLVILAILPSKKSVMRAIIPNVKIRFLLVSPKIIKSTNANEISNLDVLKKFASVGKLSSGLKKSNVLMKHANNDMSVQSEFVPNAIKLKIKTKLVIEW